MNTEREEVERVKPLDGLCCQTVQDLQDDCAEFELLLAEVSARIGEDAGLAVRARRLRYRLLRLKERVNGERTVVELLESGDQLLQLQPELRALYRLAGAGAVAEDWQSPMFDGFAPYSLSARDRRVEEHNFDYKRDRHLIGLEYELRFLREFYPPELVGPARGYLTNSGMAAMATAIHFVAQQSERTAPILVGKGCYHENKTLLQGVFGDRIVWVDERESEVLGSLICSLRPAAVFLDGVGNSFELPVPDIARALALNVALGEDAPWLILDMTCLPLSIPEFAGAASLKRLRRTIVVESLLKYHQYGLDIVNGGMLVAFDAQDELWFLRAHLGAAMADSSVRALPLPNRASLEKRLGRIQRTSSLLVAHLDSFSGERVVGPCRFPGRANVLCPLSFRGGIIAVPAAFDSVEGLRELQQLLLQLAKRVRCPLVAGTSFGFCISRLYLTAATTRYGKPFLRLSPGKETALATERLKRVLDVLR